MAREISHPFLIARDDAGHFRLTVRDTRYNSQGFALFTATMQEQVFRTAGEARDQLGDDVAVYLDGGPAQTGIASTIVDVTADVPRILRAGAVGVEALREVVPDIVA